MRYVLPLLVLLVSACTTTPPDYSGVLEERYGTTCRNLGLEKGTPAYADCLVKMHRR
jgi:hypothetical protein